MDGFKLFKRGFPPVQRLGDLIGVPSVYQCWQENLLDRSYSSLAELFENGRLFDWRTFVSTLGGCGS